jgi:hypothetical protein
VCFRGLGPPAAAAEEGRGASARLFLAGLRSVGVSHRLPSPRPWAGWSGQRDSGRQLQPPSGAAGAGTGKCRGFRPRHAGAAWWRRGRDVELRRGPRAGAARAGGREDGRADGDACRRRPNRWVRPQLAFAASAASRPALPARYSRAAAHGASAPRVPRLPSASRAQAGGGSPQRGVGTSRVTDLFEGGGWGRVGCARIIFLYSNAVLWTSRAELFQLVLRNTAGI